MIATILGGVVRALIASLGGWLVSKGYISSSDVAQVTSEVSGAIMVVAVAVWSAKKKVDHKRDVADSYSTGHADGVVSVGRELRQPAPAVGPVPEAGGPAVETRPSSNAADG